MHKADEDEAEGRNRKERMISVTAVTAATVLRIPDRYRKTVTAVTTVTEERQMQKNVQISYELFIDLIKFHLFGFDENEAKIRMDLKRKLNTMCARELYTKYKTAGTDAEREEARQKYLDSRGIPEDFRW